MNHEPNIVRVEVPSADRAVRSGACLPSLRILMVMNFVWSRGEGGPRTSVDLAAELGRLTGSTVDKFDLNDAGVCKNARLAPYFAHFHFRRAAIRHVSRVASQYDIIQAEPGILPVSKQALGFRGLLVARSNGLPQIYARWEAAAEKKRKQAGEPRPGKVIGNALRAIARPFNTTHARIAASFLAADLVVTINQDELRFVADELGLASKVVMLPNGLTEEDFSRFENVMPDPAQRASLRRVAFVGYWSERKGSDDFPALIRSVRASTPQASFLLLGTHKPAEIVLAKVAARDRPYVRVVPRYDPADLPTLLATATVAVMPSYVEGFPLAVLETLASGLPTVGYDAAGTREMLNLFRKPTMTAAGDAPSLAKLVTGIFSLSLVDYDSLSKEAVTIARRFRWRQIACDWLDAYARAGVNSPW
jgi:glycosyltransferase involved in cell wall biosynthesis